MQPCADLTVTERSALLNRSSTSVYASSQGLVHKFLAIEEMFDRDPKLAERVSFVQVRAVTDRDAQTRVTRLSP